MRISLEIHDDRVYEPYGMVKKLMRDDRLVLALWIQAAYLLVLCAALRWGHPSPARYPGSD